MYETYKLEKHPYSQCHVVVNEFGIHFISYNTQVISINNLGYLDCRGTYSQTTRRQIGWFLREYAPKLSYYDAKYCAEKNCCMNIYTREVMNIPLI